jgi:hypothetical protein
MSPELSLRVVPCSLIVIASANSTVAVHRNARAMPIVSNPGPRFAEDAGAEAEPMVIAAPVL